MPQNTKFQKLRQLGLLTATALVIANMIGTGIFTTTGFLAQDMAGPLPILIGWVLGGVVALCGALTYAELAVNMPGSGGEYLYLSKLYHPGVGFISGWVSLFAGFSAPIAAAAVAFGKYFNVIMPAVPPLSMSIALLLVFTLLHLLNVRLGSVIQNFVTIIKTTMIATLVVIALVLPGEPVDLSTGGDHWRTVFSPAFAVGLIFIMFSYSGWNAAAYIGGEVKDPSRVLPVSLIAGTAIVVLLYTGLNIFYLAYVPLENIAGQVEVAFIVAREVIGSAGAQVVSVLILLALITSVSGMTMAGSRVYQVMGEDHPFFAWLAKRSRTKSPVNAILLQSSVSLILILTLSFDAILYYVGFTLSLFAALAVFGVFILRKRGMSQKRYRTWGYPFTPLLFLAVTIWMIIYTFLDRTLESLIGLGTLGIGLVIFMLTRRKKPEGVFEDNSTNQ